MKLTDKVEGLSTEVQDTQQLIGALHGEPSPPVTALLACS